MSWWRLSKSLWNLKTWQKGLVTDCLQNKLALRWIRTGSLLLDMTEGEKKLTDLLKEKLNPTYIEVNDISGGCGAMYQVIIDSELFKGKRTIQQHKMVNEALGDEIKSLHGLTIQIGNPTEES